MYTTDYESNNEIFITIYIEMGHHTGTHRDVFKKFFTMNLILQFILLILQSNLYNCMCVCVCVCVYIYVLG